MQQALLAVDDAAIHAWDYAFIFCTLGPVGRRILKANLRAIKEQIQFFRAVVLDFLIEIEEPAVGIAYPSPATLAKGDVMDSVLVVEALVKVHELVNVELANLA